MYILTFLVTEPTGKQYSTAYSKVFRFPVDALHHEKEFIKEFKLEERSYFIEYEHPSTDEKWEDYFSKYSFQSNIAIVNYDVPLPTNSVFPPL